MTQFPSEVFTPRELENRPGVEYDPTKKRILFAEDLQKISDEVVSLEKSLLNTDDKKIPFGLKIGDSDCNLQIIKLGGISDKIALILGNGLWAGIENLLAMSGCVIRTLDDGQFGIDYFVDLVNGKSMGFGCSIPDNTFFMDGSLSMNTLENQLGFNLEIVDEDDNILYSAQLGIKAEDGKFHIDNDFVVDEKKIKAAGYIASDDSEGITETITNVVDVQIVGGVAQKKTQTNVFKNGLLVEVGEISAWT